MSITSISKRQLHFDRYGTPECVGPGSYDPYFKDSRVRSQIACEIPFGSTTRRELFTITENENVGPGAYDPQLIVRGASPKYNIGLSSKRNYFVDNQKTPSPADYSNLTPWVKAKPKEPSQWQHPNQIRPVSANDERAPSGLGNKDIDRDCSTDESNFGRALEDLDSMRLKTIKQTIRESMKPQVRPGSRAHDFSRSRTPQREPVNDNGIPGPADYGEIPHMNIRKGKSPAFYPGGKEAGWALPSNGNETMLGHVAWCDVEPAARAFGTGSKRELPFYIPDTPGAGQYDIKSAKKKYSNRTGFGATRYEQRSQTPGPGYYDLVKDEKKVVGKRDGERCKRSDLWKIQEGPAPNQYEVDEADIIERKELLRRQSPAFKDRSTKWNLENPEPNPGPKYNTRPKIKAKGGLPRAARFTDKTYAGARMNDDPSPADYIISRDERIRGGSMSRNAHRPSDKTDTPGPGKYRNVRSELSKPSYNVMFNPSLQKARPYR